MQIGELRLRLDQRRSAFNRRVGQAQSLAGNLSAARSEVEELSRKIETLDQISALLAGYADEQQAKVQGSIETIVTTGLRTIFDEDLALRIENRMNGRRPEVQFILASRLGDETLETSILDARGGGVAAVAGFLIQAVMALLTPNVRPVLFLDETFGQLSEGYLDPLAAFIKELVDRSDLQVVLVTHSDVFSSHADTTYRFAQERGITSISRESPQ